MLTQRFAPGAINAPAAIRALLGGGLTLGQMRAMSPLPEDSQKLIDTAVVRVGLERLVFVADLMAEGLTYPLTDPMSVMEVQWDSVSKTGGAFRTMSPGARGEYQIQDRLSSRVPIYITSDDFSFGIRVLAASRRVGQPLDTSHAEEATRRVNEAIEDAALNGAGINVASDTTPGVLTQSSVNTYAYLSNEAWDVVGHDGNDILTDVLAMIAKLQADKKFGPYNLYVNTTYGNKLNEDFKANSDLTIRQRLEQIEVGGRNLRVRVADRLATNRTVLIQMTSDVVDLVQGFSPTVVSWTSNDGFTLYWNVMAIQVPRVRADYDGNSGICTGNTT